MAVKPGIFAASDESVCQYCEAHVSRDFRRVYGDDNDRVHRCRECDTMVRIRAGSAAGLDVSTPDPLESPGRHGNNGAEWCR